MKIIGSVKEDLSLEKRISITPETVKKFIKLKASVFLEKNYGSHLGIKDDDYKSEGATICDSDKEVIQKTDIFLQVNVPSNENANLIKEKSILIGQFDHFANKDIFNKLFCKQINKKIIV